MFLSILGAFLVGCNPSSNQSINEEITSPTVEITSPKDLSPYLKPFTATAIVADPNGTPSELKVRWFAGKREVCPFDTPDVQGGSSCEIALKPTEKTISAEVTDRQKQTATATVNILKDLVTEKVQKPNIVLVVVDTLRADRLAVHGGNPKITPTMNALAAEGIWFSRAFAQSGWTLPSFVSLWTGMYPNEHRVGRDANDRSQFGTLPEETETLAESLLGAGYHTMAVVNNTFLAPSFGVQQGFSVYSYQGADNADFRSATQTTQKVLSLVDEQTQQKPFFMVVHYMEPHMNLDPPPAVRGTFAPVENPPVKVPFVGREAFALTDKGGPSPSQLEYILNLYNEEVLFVDLALGKLVDGLKKRELWEDTLFVLTSDHGEEFWDHGGFEHGHSLMSVLTHIPLFATGPGIRGFGKSSVLVEHVDLYRTFLEVAGVQKAGRGRNLFVLSQWDKALSAKGQVLERWGVSENILYGDPKVSMVTPNHRLIINQKEKQFAVWNVDAGGWETDILKDQEREKHSQILIENLSRVRGGIEAIQNVAGVRIPNRQLFQQLKKLGYLEERE